MHQEFAPLKRAIESSNTPDAVQRFKKYCNAFKGEILSEVPQTFLAKIVKRQTPLETGIDNFHYIIKSGFLKKMPWLDFVQSITPLFQVLLHPFINMDIHLKSFDLLLDVLSGLEDDAETKDYSLKLVGDIVVYGLQLFLFIDKANEMYNTILPENKLAMEQDFANFHEIVKIMITFLAYICQFIYISFR